MATTSTLPVDTIEIEILPRLPVKSLLRFKSVCKSWNSLISGDVFIKSVRNSNLTLLSCGRLHDVEVQEFAWIAGCINGLVLLEYLDMDGATSLGFKIWNPSTKRCLEIAPRPDQTEFDRSHNYLIAFCFDSVANDYKIIDGISMQGHPLVGYIYSCNAGSWSKIANSNFLHPGYIDNTVNVYVKGSPFWWIKQGRPYWCEHKIVCLSFNVQQEFFRLLPDLVPRGSITNRNYRECYKLLNFRDSLAVLFHNSDFFWGEAIDIYVFNEKCNDWSKTFFGPFKFLCKVPSSRMMPMFLQCCRNDGILFVSSDFEDEKLYWVYPENYTVKSLGKVGDFGNYVLYSHACSESLVSIDGMKPFYEKQGEFNFLFLNTDCKGI